MRITILDLKHPSVSICLTFSQKKKLLDVFKKNDIRFIISRKAIRLNRLRSIYEILPKERKILVEKILEKVELRAGNSKCIKVDFCIDLTPNLCWLNGFLLGDGSTLHVCRFYNINSTLTNEVNNIVKTHFGVETKKETNTQYNYIIPKPVLLVLEAFFGKKGKSVDARVPPIIYKLPKEYVASFIRGIFDTDGTVSGNPCICTPNINLLNDLKHLLKEKFVIKSRIRQHNSKDYNEFDLTLGQFKKVDTFFNVLKFHEQIGFIHPNKRLKLDLKVKSRALYSILQLVKGGFTDSYQISDILDKDRSTIIDHLNKLEKFNLIEKRIEYFGRNKNLKEFKWYSII